MSLSSITNVSKESLAREFLRQSQGKWQSQRRYYTLKQENEPEEVISLLTVQFLESEAPELIKLAELHQLDAGEEIMIGQYLEKRIK
jgi:hypothetical protein